jgi:cell division protein FtsW
MAKRLASDRQLFAVAVALLACGLLAVWSASSAIAQEKHGNPYHFLLRQGVAALLGLIALFGVMRLDYLKLKRPAVVYGMVILATVLLIVALLLPPINDSRRWIRLLGLSFQPSELAKLAVILFLAYHIERKGERVNDLLTSVFPAFLLLVWFAYLISIEPDLGTALTVAFVGGVMLFLAGVRLRYFVAFAAVGVIGLYQALLVLSDRRIRLGAYLNPWADARGSGYQLIQSLIAVGTGGPTGVGLMEGRQKLFYLPYPFSDFVYAVVAEELGLIGALFVLLAFLFLLWRGIRTASRAREPFGVFLAGGLTLAIVIQALTNISVVVGLFPTKGIPLPFLSAGGSSLILTLLAVGLILNVSQHVD